ncbi:MAG TPA: hypothetical protein PK950_00840 [Candidatus Paceibacterota bacterium]|nr:hypothetical protein [Candidatus Paceibacterota bacterium]
MNNSESKNVLVVSAGQKSARQASELLIVAELLSIIKGSVTVKTATSFNNLEDGVVDVDTIIEKYSQKSDGAKIIYLQEPLLSPLMLEAHDARVSVPELLMMKHPMLRENPLAVELVHYHMGFGMDRNPKSIVHLSHAIQVLDSTVVPKMVGNSGNVYKEIQGKIEEWMKDESLEVKNAQIEGNAFKKDVAIACIVISATDRKKFSMQNLLKNLQDEDGNPCAFLAVVIKDQPEGKEKSLELYFAPWAEDMIKRVKDAFIDHNFRSGPHVGDRKNPTFVTTEDIDPSEVINIIEEGYDYVSNNVVANMESVPAEEVAVD